MEFRETSGNIYGIPWNFFNKKCKVVLTHVSFSIPFIHIDSDIINLISDTPVSAKMGKGQQKSEAVLGKWRIPIQWEV